jgi:hypothetical protein
MLRPIAENPFADRQIAEFQFAEKLICWKFYLLKNIGKEIFISFRRKTGFWNAQFTKKIFENLWYVQMNYKHSRLF